MPGGSRRTTTFSPELGGLLEPRDCPWSLPDRSLPPLEDDFFALSLPCVDVSLLIAALLAFVIIKSEPWPFQSSGWLEELHLSYETEAAERWSTYRIAFM